MAGIILLSFCQQAIFAFDRLVDLNQTKLISFVQESEEELASLKNQHEEFWNCCFIVETIETSKGSKIKNNDNPKCKVSDIKSLKTVRNDLKRFEELTKNKIVEMLKEGFDINAVDNQGKTVLNYAKTPFIYNFLRDSGAEFQVGAFLNMNKNLLIPLSIFGTGIAAKLYQEGFFDGVASENLKDHENLLFGSALFITTTVMACKFFNYSGIPATVYTEEDDKLITKLLKKIESK